MLGRACLGSLPAVMVGGGLPVVIRLWEASNSINAGASRLPFLISISAGKQAFHASRN